MSDRIDVAQLLNDCDSAISWCRHRHHNSEDNEPELDAVIARIRKLLKEPHVVTFAANGWSVEHSVLCRPNMLSCDIHRAVAIDALRGPPAASGRYTVALGPRGLEYTAVNKGGT